MLQRFIFFYIVLQLARASLNDIKEEISDLPTTHQCEDSALKDDVLSREK